MLWKKTILVHGYILCFNVHIHVFVHHWECLGWLCCNCHNPRANDSSRDAHDNWDMWLIVHCREIFANGATHHWIKPPKTCQELGAIKLSSKSIGVKALLCILWKNARPLPFWWAEPACFASSNFLLLGHLLSTGGTTLRCKYETQDFDLVILYDTFWPNIH